MTTYLKLTSVYFIVFFSLLSCQKDVSDPGGDGGRGNPPYIYDTDALLFLNSAGISDSLQKVALNEFVVQLKDSLLWSKFKAIYPMLGGTASSTMLNLKDPRNADDAYRLSYYGAPVFANTGVLFPTLSDYADTHLADSSIGGYNNASISYYSRTQNTISGYDMGCADNLGPFNELSIYCTSADNTEWFGYSPCIASPNTTGLFMLSSSTGNVSRYRNGVVVSASSSAPADSYTNFSFWLGTTRYAVDSGKKECALATIGNGLNDAEAMTFYTIVQNFQTKIGR